MAIMLKLISIMEELNAHPRQCTIEENLYLMQVGQELARAESDAGRWRILEREGLSRIDGFDFSEEIMAELTKVRRAAMN